MRTTERLKEIAGLTRGVASCIWPPACWVCGAATSPSAAGEAEACDAHRLPDPAASALDRRFGGGRARCPRCAATLPSGVSPRTRCAGCRLRPPAFSRVHFAFDYADPAVRAWVLALKHGGRRDLAVPLAAILAGVMARASGARGRGARPRPPSRTALVPVPLHPSRRLERGHDQAAELSRRLASARVGVHFPCLGRVRSTPPQGDPAAPSRAANVRGAFRCLAPPPPSATRVILVDDVVTTTSTAHACARELRRAGAREVEVLAIARA